MIISTQFQPPHPLTSLRFQEGIDSESSASPRGSRERAVILRKESRSIALKRELRTLLESIDGGFGRHDAGRVRHGQGFLFRVVSGNDDVAKIRLAGLDVFGQIDLIGLLGGRVGIERSENEGVAIPCLGFRLDREDLEGNPAAGF